MKQLIEEAINTKMKLLIQMQDTEDDKFIVFHPYAIIEDILMGYSVFGNVEKHHTNIDTNFLSMPTLRGLKSVQLIEERFEYRLDWKDVIAKDGLNVIFPYIK